MTGLYIHIPFCKSRCGYCDFCTTDKHSEKLMDEYLNALIEQMNEFSTGGKDKLKIDTVYFGGGTPSFFGGKRIARLLKEIKKRAELQKSVEITVEANPESCDKRFCKQMKGAGVTRLSIGVQSAVDSELFTIGRAHTFRQAREAVETARKYLTENISLDLIFGLPDQTAESWRQSLEQVVELKPEHISAYALKLESGCAMYGKEMDFPDEDAQAEMYLYAVEFLRQKGFEQYEISNFASESRISRHNSKYWDLSEYLALGAGAHSFFRGHRYSFVSDIGEFIEKCVSGESVIAEKEDGALQMRHRKGEYIMLMLRTARGIDEELFFRLFGVDFAPYARRLEKYLRSGHALHDGMRYRLTPKGFLISNTILVDVLEDI